MRACVLLALLCCFAAQAQVAERSPLDDLRRRYTDEAFLEGEAGLSAAAAAGREIWYKATGGNALFHAETLPELGFVIDWFRVLRADRRGERFKRWGLINDPGCCAPGTRGCPAESLEQTYGYDWCAGDDELLRYVGKEGYADPACSFREAPSSTQPAQRESACELAFGTSAGAVGFRKFPNPRFDADAWRRGGTAKTVAWEGYPARPVEQKAQPPFLIGIACGACHVGFDPLNAPRDPANPKWDNLRASVGNQYLRFGEILGSALPHASLRYTLLAFGRPGTLDTSLIEDDRIANPSSINAVINLAQRPTPNGALNLMKGGEDSTGLLDSTRRVYLSMGVCAQQCLLDHLEDAQQHDPALPRYRQSPVNLAQCRSDCAAFRALDDRVAEVAQFLYSHDAQPTALRAAREQARRRGDPAARYSQAQLIRDLEREFGRGAVKRGQRLFVQHCARCHSSAPAALASADDWLGNDLPTAASEVGTNACRALHSNHLQGNIWQPFASAAYQQRGRGYYRNVSLLSVWAHAPFMHNNAIGPELCRYPQPARGCWAYDPSVAGRFRLYEASMRELLSASRPAKTRRLHSDLLLPFALLPPGGGRAVAVPRHVELIIAKGANEVTLGSFDFKRFERDLAAALHDAVPLRAQLIQRHGAGAGTRAWRALKQLAQQRGTKLRVDLSAPALRPYRNCDDEIENAGHRYGSQLSARDKNALIAFVATL